MSGSRLLPFRIKLMIRDSYYFLLKSLTSALNIVDMNLDCIEICELKGNWYFVFRCLFF